MNDQDDDLWPYIKRTLTTLAISFLACAVLVGLAWASFQDAGRSHPFTYEETAR